MTFLAGLPGFNQVFSAEPQSLSRHHSPEGSHAAQHLVPGLGGVWCRQPAAGRVTLGASLCGSCRGPSPPPAPSHTTKITGPGLNRKGYLQAVELKRNKTTSFDSDGEMGLRFSIERRPSKHLLSCLTPSPRGLSESRTSHRTPQEPTPVMKCMLGQGRP